MGMNRNWEECKRLTTTVWLSLFKSGKRIEFVIKPRQWKGFSNLIKIQTEHKINQLQQNPHKWNPLN